MFLSEIFYRGKMYLRDGRCCLRLRLYASFRSKFDPIVAVLWPYSGRVGAISWPYGSRILVISWPYRRSIVAAWWPYRGRKVAAW